MLLMLFTVTATLFMSAEVGPTLLGHFGLIYLFALLMFYSVPAAYIVIHKKESKKHPMNMLRLYFGGLVIAGAFTFVPGRLLHAWIIV